MADQKQRRKSGKRSDILTAAQQLFLEKGVGAVSVEEVVRHAVVSKATFYKNFSDKSALLEHVLIHIIDLYMQQLQDFLEEARTSPMTRESFIRIFDINEYDQFFVSSFIDELIADYPDLVMRLNGSYLNEIRQLYRELIRSAKVDGIVRLDVDTDILLIYTLLLRKATIRQELQPPDGMDLKEFTAKILNLYLYGVMETEQQR